VTMNSLHIHQDSNNSKK